ncbi:hypothetical protein N802_06915 [Knoellia sinensis KCTC 19936]|uniref:GmrSD restriction endonucleases N-terminal domain-containing protein n=1 Tax=Knoellia sinensis KCTC 19936 TaxID=1385520 RepID=A0A0A0J353_9MICO|nr:hypothetical protein N802_06915 [Knoellia sinensis KCTC 19936]
MPVSSDLQQYTVADFMEWDEKKQLLLNPEFQRGSVWPPAARTYLIDTILRRLPVPKIYVRTKVDLQTKRSFREVVDGQQRLRAILDFGNDRFALGPRAQEWAGKRYSDLDPVEQERFLAYSIATDQLINASDADVLEVFSRLNSYTVPVNPPELRHAKFQGEFKWSVHEMAAEWTELWETYRVIGARDAVRLLSDSLVAEMYGIVLEGVRDGGQPKITKLYERVDKEFQRDPTEAIVNKSLRYIVDHFDDVLKQTTLSNAPHFLMLFAATAHALIGIPQGELPNRPDPGPPADPEVVRPALFEISAVLEAEEPPTGANRFKSASASSTQRIASRLVRFPVYLSAVQGRPLPW